MPLQEDDKHTLVLGSPGSFADRRHHHRRRRLGQRQANGSPEAEDRPSQHIVAAPAEDSEPDNKIKYILLVKFVIYINTIECSVRQA